jgi:(1->4)-alpha-D-glucan 1-alpha-D-glucosylmutase
VDPSVFDFLYRLLSTDLVAQPRSGFSRDSVVRFAMRVQQYSGPVMAKGLEDTAFYRYNRYIALNEVGGHPDHFGVSIAAFHKANVQRATHSPHAMLATATHDTKRGEDVRARLAVLAEMPDEWCRQVHVWSRLLRARLGDLEGTAPPDRNDEYMFYQLLVGAWLAELTGAAELDRNAVSAFAQRLEPVMIKSVREAKLHSTWNAPNVAYEEALLGFVNTALDTSRPNAFLDAFLPFQARIAKLGVSNSLVQTALKLTLPGMPDIYQGAELWDLSLVDPDNRRPVDFAHRTWMLETTMSAMARERSTAMMEMAENWRDGRIKLGLMATLLAVRRQHPMLFAAGSYEPLQAVGPRTDHICAFARAGGDHALVVITARFPARLMADPDWDGTAVAPPRSFNHGLRWRDLLTGQAVEWCAGEALPLQALPSSLPVVVLVPDNA